MVIKNYRTVKAQAYEALRFTPWDTKKLVMVYAAVALGGNLLASVVTTLLNHAAQNATGLSGIQTYSMLATASSFLQLAVSIGMIFWNIALPYCFLMILRNQDPYPSGLLHGFRRWAPIVRYMLLIGLYAIAIIWAIAMVATMVATPFMTGIADLVSKIPANADPTTYLAELPTSELLAVFAPMLIIYVVALLAILVPLSYRIQLAPMLILDDPHIGARLALKFSFTLTKGSCMQLFLMDLSFWWYHLLTALCTAIPYAALLPAFKSWGIGADILFSAVQAAALFGVYTLGLAKVQTAGAAAYNHLRTIEPQNNLQLPDSSGGTYG